MSLELLQSEFLQLLTMAWLWSLLTIILIDITMSWDNAIVIWMATRWLPEKQRKKAIMIWIALATILRIIFAFLVSFLLSIVWIKIAWWLLLLYVVWKFYKEIRMQEWHEDSGVKKATTFFSSIMLIVIADVSMSLDNVLAVAWAANENIVALWIWLIISIILMAIASNFIANKLEKYPQIQWIWLLIILYVAVEMLLDWWKDVSEKLWTWEQIAKNFMPALIFLISLFGFFLHNKYIKPIEKKNIQDFFAKNYLIILIFNLLLLFFVALWWDIIKSFLFSHVAILYTFTFIIFFIIIEIIAIYKHKR